MTETIARPILATIPHVELMHAGTWNISTGTATFTSDDLAAAVAALDCPAIRRPVLKLGHTDARFDGEPAVGWIANLSTDGSTMWGDYTGMPRWLADVAASAYPDRSIEGWYDFQCQIGHTHPFVLTGVALLGVTAPGIGTLESLQDVAKLYGVEAAADGGEHARKVTMTEGASMPRAVKASANVEDVRRAYYEDAPWSFWITEIQLDPAQIIVMDDENGALMRVPYTIDPAGDGEDAVAFGTPVPVVIRYEDSTPQGEPDMEPVAASARPQLGAVYASRAESRPKAGDPTIPPATEPEDTNTQEEIAMSDTIKGGILERLGLSPDTDLDDAGILSALDEKLGQPATPAEGTVVMSSLAYQEMAENAKRGAQAFARQQETDRDNAIAAAIHAGKISAGRKEDWKLRWDKDPVGAKADLDLLPDGLIPVTASGYPGRDTDKNADDATYAGLFGDTNKED